MECYLKNLPADMAYAPDLPACVVSGDTEEDTEKLIYEAIEFHIDGMEKGIHSIPHSVTGSEIMVFC